MNPRDPQGLQGHAQLSITRITAHRLQGLGLPVALVKVLKQSPAGCSRMQRDTISMSAGAVAARAAGREVQGGYKDEGVVPVAMHLEETRFLQAS